MYINIRQLCIPIQKGCIERKWHFTMRTQSRTISTKTVPIYSQAKSNSIHPSYPYQTGSINFANYRRFYFKCPDASMWSRLRIKFQRIYILIEFFFVSFVNQSSKWSPNKKHQGNVHFFVFWKVEDLMYLQVISEFYLISRFTLCAVFYI